MERWQQIESLFQEALQHDPIERDAWLREVCRDDSGLRREVSSLLANHRETPDFEPWPAAAAAQLIGERGSLEAGQCLGPYEILAPIGKGGMGEVYKARDTRLKRDVAIKICAAQFSERFEREARAIAALNHPHICQLYDVGPNFLVMELVEGENLSGPLPVETALDYARQIAEALEAAHEKGIVHRDLKPANVRITPAGLVKVLDFGLAKAAEDPAGVSRDPSISPTMTMSRTRGGMILGTAPYMAPEQVRAASVDKRADIWAFGCVLYEMLSGEQTFHGETTSDILAAVLREEPDWSRIPARTRLLLRRCLVKDRKHRLRDIGDAMPLLDGEPDLAPARRSWPWLVSAILAIALAAACVLLYRAARPAPSHRPLRLNVELAPETALESRNSLLALSPDGTLLAFNTLCPDGKIRLSVRRLDQNQVTQLSGTEGARSGAFFSPDGQWIAFMAEGKLKKIRATGGAAVTLNDAQIYYSGDWGDDGGIVGPLGVGTGLSRIPAAGGATIPVTELNREKGEVAHRWPQVLPGSQAVLFSVYYATDSYDSGGIDVVSLKTGKRKTIYHGGFFGRYLPSGHLVYVHQNTLFAAPFDLSQLQLAGEPQPLIEDVSNARDRGANFAFSQTGTFIYAGGQGQLQRSIFWLDSAGKLRPLRPDPGLYSHPRFSPDGKRLAFVTDDGQGHDDIRVQDLEHGTTTRLNVPLGSNSSPVWTPDGMNVIFSSLSPAAPGIYSMRADGSGEAWRVTDNKTRGGQLSISPDGKWLVKVEASPISGVHIIKIPIEGDLTHPRLGKAEPFVESKYITIEPAFSRDGRWLAYGSNEPGREGLWVRPFPGPGSGWLIWSGVAGYPIWSHNGRELFFLSDRRRIMVVGYTARGDSFMAGQPQPWSEKRLLNLGSPPVYTYDLAPDGKRFAVVLYPDGTADERPITYVTFLLNFFDELRLRVPVGGK